jgi:hypothetical protein
LKSRIGHSGIFVEDSRRSLGLVSARSVSQQTNPNQRSAIGDVKISSEIGK